MKPFKFLQKEEKGTLDTLELGETRATASFFAGVSRRPTLIQYHGNYEAYSEAMRRYLRSEHLRGEELPTPEQNLINHIERIKDFNDNNIGFVNADSIQMKPKWWMRIKMKFQAIKFWSKQIDWYLVAPIIMFILIVSIPMFYMLIYTILQK